MSNIIFILSRLKILVSGCAVDQYFCLDKINIMLDTASSTNVSMLLLQYMMYSSVFVMSFMQSWFLNLEVFLLLQLNQYNILV